MIGNESHPRKARFQARAKSESDSPFPPFHPRFLVLQTIAARQLRARKGDRFILSFLRFVPVLYSARRNFKAIEHLDVERCHCLNGPGSRPSGRCGGGRDDGTFKLLSSSRSWFFVFFFWFFFFLSLPNPRPIRRTQPSAGVLEYLEGPRTIGGFRG